MYKVEDIKIIPYVRFQTPDGALHDTMDKALEHTPVYCPKYKLWAANKLEGVFETDDIEQAGFIYCPDNCAAEDFINDSQAEGYTVDGIDGEGWYVWDEDNYAWVRMPEGTISLFENFLL